MLINNACGVADCLGDDFIGVRCGDGTAESTSGLYLNDLPGINRTLATATADADTVTGENLMKNAVRQAVRLVQADFLNLIAEKHTILDLVSSYQYGEHDPDGAWETGATTETLLATTFDHDPFLYATLDYVEILLQDEGDGQPRTITVFADGVAMEDTTWVPRAGYNRIPLGQSFKQSIQVDLDLTGLTYSTRETTSNQSSYCRCLKGHDHCAPCVSVDNPYGFIAVISCRADVCELMRLFCAQLATPVLYRAGAFFLEELLLTQRVNHYVRGGKAQAEQLIDRWMGSQNMVTGVPNQGEYYRQLKRAATAAIKMLDRSTSKAFQKEGTLLKTFIP